LTLEYGKNPSHFIHDPLVDKPNAKRKLIAGNYPLLKYDIDSQTNLI